MLLFFFQTEKSEKPLQQTQSAVVLLHFANLSRLVGALIWANRVIRLYVYCPVMTSLAGFLQ